MGGVRASRHDADPTCASPFGRSIAAHARNRDHPRLFLPALRTRSSLPPLCNPESARPPRRSARRSARSKVASARVDFRCRDTSPLMRPGSRGVRSSRAGLRTHPARPFSDCCANTSPTLWCRSGLPSSTMARRAMRGCRRRRAALLWNCRHRACGRRQQAGTTVLLLTRVFESAPDSEYPKLQYCGRERSGAAALLHWPPA